MGDFLATVFAVVLGNFTFHWLIAKMNEVVSRYGQYDDNNYDDWF